MNFERRFGRRQRELGGRHQPLTCYAEHEPRRQIDTARSVANRPPVYVAPFRPFERFQSGFGARRPEAHRARHGPALCWCDFREPRERENHRRNRIHARES
jgi:hypothetical protein